MQLPTSGPSPHPTAQGPYHGGPPNVVVQNAGVGPPPQAMHLPPHHVLINADGHPMRGPPMPGPMPGPPPPGHPAGPVAMCPPTLESRIYEMNKRIQIRSDDPDASSLWWDAFANEFFDDDAKLTLTFTLDDGPKRYTIGRTLIPRYFRTLLEGGVKDLHFVLRYPCREFMPQPGVIRLECDNVLTVTRHDKPKPMFTEVYTEGMLVCESILEEPYNMPRIRNWMMDIRNFQEFVPRQELAARQGLNTDPPYQEQLTKNITRQGLTSLTLNYLRLCVILEPMQQLMSQHKAFKIGPRECLRSTLFQRFNSANAAVAQQRPPPPTPMTQPMIMPPETEVPRPPAKRKRNRKGSSSAGGTPSGGGGKKKNSVSPGPASGHSLALTSHVDVMVVGEPSLMGGEYGEEDERLISRLENTQYDPAVAGQMAAPPGAQAPMPRPANGAPGVAPFDAASVLSGWTAERRASPSTPQTPSSRMGTPSVPGPVPPAPVGSNGSGRKSEATPESGAESGGAASGSAASSTA